MTTDARNSRGQFTPGNKASQGRPKLTEMEIATRDCLQEIDAVTPILVAQALDRAQLGEPELMAPALTILGEILKARNLDREERLRNEAKILHAEMLRAATNPAPSNTAH